MTTTIEPMAAVKVLREAVETALQDDQTKVTYDVYQSMRAAFDATAQVEAPTSEPINMILHCPSCGLQHIDAPDQRTENWKNEPHRSHLCHGCGHIWRPADVPTNGVAAIATKGTADSPVAPQALPATGQAKPLTPHGIDYIMAAVQCFASEWRQLADRRVDPDVMRAQAVATKARIRNMLEDVASSQPSPAKPDLSGLIALLQSIKPKYGDAGSRDDEVTAQRKRIEDAIALLATHPVAQAKPDASERDRVLEEAATICGNLCDAARKYGNSEREYGLAFAVQDIRALKSVAATTSKPNAAPSGTGENNE